MSLQIHYANETYGEGVRSVLPKLPLRLRQHFLVFWTEYRVGNGGLAEFFALGEEVPFLEESITAFADMGLPRAADVLRKAAKIHTLENKKLETARKLGKGERFMEEYGHDAYDKLQKAYDDLSWFFLEERLRFIERNTSTNSINPPTNRWGRLGSKRPEASQRGVDRADPPYCGTAAFFTDSIAGSWNGASSASRSARS